MKIIIYLLLLLPAELAHNFVIKFLKLCNFLIIKNYYHNNKLSQNLFNLKFNHPVGLAAGFDKNGVAVSALAKFGFAFIEVGTVTLKPQIGNKKPRIFKNIASKEIINSLGFNNKGVDNLLGNISKYQGQSLIGINIGPNKGIDDIRPSIIKLIQKTQKQANYITINLSSPNTQNLRSWSDSSKLNQLLEAISNIGINNNIPVLLKLSPDIDKKNDKHIVEACLKYKIAGLIISNTTITRPQIDKSIGKIKLAKNVTFGNNQNKLEKFYQKQGGLSGCYLETLANGMIRRYFKLTKGKIPIIGVGGIISPYDAVIKIRAGASLVQIYSGFIFNGPKFIGKILLEIEKEMKKNNFENISKLIGIDAK